MIENVSFKKEANALFLKVSGRIDSANAAQVEEEMVSIKNQNPAESTIIDAEQLEYISSAGLRIILRMRKEIPDLKLINVNSEVYEILDMTGFTEMMTIEKAYRVLSVDGCEVIGRGSNGEVYRLDPDTIIKVYFNKDSLPDINRERELARKAFVLGIPTAIPYDVVKVGESFGSVFELLDADSFTNILAREPEKIDEIVDMYVDLLKKIHSTEVKPTDMPDMKSTAIMWAKDVQNYLNPEKWKKLVDIIEKVPNNNHMIHGDYHTKNVMIQNGEVLLIDMDTLCYGDPVFEFGSIYNAYLGFYDGKPPVDGLTFIGIPYNLGVEFWNKTIVKYFGTDDEEFLRSVTDKSKLIGYTRLLRRTYRRCDMNDASNKALCDFYVKEIENILDRIDNIQF